MAGRPLAAFHQFIAYFKQIDSNAPKTNIARFILVHCYCTLFLRFIHPADLQHDLAEILIATGGRWPVNLTGTKSA